MNPIHILHPDYLIRFNTSASSNFYSFQILLFSHLIVVMVKCGVLFEVRTEFLNTLWTSFDFRGLNQPGY
jgi:hypothetical protein